MQTKQKQVRLIEFIVSTRRIIDEHLEAWCLGIRAAPNYELKLENATQIYG